MLILLLLLSIFILAVFLCYILTAAEAALIYLPGLEAERLLGQQTGPELNHILTNLPAHMFAIRLWRVVSENLALVFFFSALYQLTGLLWVSALLTVIVLSPIGLTVFGYYPRRSGRKNPENYVKLTRPIIYWLGRVLGPLPQLIVSREGQDSTQSTSEASFTEEELREFVNRANTSEVIEDDEAQMVHSIFELDETRIRSVMVPRTDMVTLEVADSLDAALNLFVRSGYSRIPVLGKDFDDIQGFLYLKDLLEVLLTSSSDGRQVNLEGFLRPARFEPESKRVMDLLKEMQRESTHVAIVVDEYGGTAGLVTLEDLIEELVGDISDEFDQDKTEVVAQEDGTFKISSRLSLEDFGELFGMDMSDEDVDTVGGLLAKHLGKVAVVGSQVTVAGIHIRAIGTQGRRNRINRLLVWPEGQQPHLS